MSDGNFPKIEQEANRKFLRFVDCNSPSIGKVPPTCSPEIARFSKDGSPHICEGNIGSRLVLVKANIFNDTILPISVGIKPVSKFSPKAAFSRDASVVTSTGMVPRSSLNSTLRVNKFFSNANSVGIVELRRLELNLKVSSKLILPTSVGMEPVSFPSSSFSVFSWPSNPISVGIAPTRPGFEFDTKDSSRDKRPISNGRVPLTKFLLSSIEKRLSSLHSIPAQSHLE
mmetsp:Transcript_33314/g.47300  ORF Transcript_33314/g.47300 Transcript_33314/m.47300 type:complete len:228 (-) Transcript_33314:1577-2260(-)